MEFSIAKSAFASAMAHINAVVPHNAARPVMQGVLLKAEGQKVLLSGTDLEIAMQVALDAEVAIQGQVLLQARQLGDLVGRLPGDTVALQVDGDVATVSAGRGKFKLAGMPVVDYPEISVVMPDTSVGMRGDDLAKGVAKTIFAASRGDTRYALNGLFFSFAGSAVDLVASDTYRLALYHAAVDGEMSGDGIVLTKGATLAGKLAAGSERVAVALTENDFYLRVGDVCLRSRLIAGAFPRYGSVIPEKKGARVVVKRDEFAKALAAVAVVVNPESRAVSMGVDSDAIRLFSDSESSASGGIVIDAEMYDDPAPVKFNYAYMTEALKTFECEAVTMWYQDSGSPILISEGGCTQVVMPVGIGE